MTTATTAPVVAHTRQELKAAREALSSRDVAVVMTMGALHDGHAQLIRAARQRHDHVVVTIFLNPLQFGPKEDLSRYPRTFDADLEICTAAGVDVVFAPTPDVVYPDGDPGVRVSAGPLGEVLEGASRPGHFDGVLTVVGKLLHLTAARSAYFGQKDAQQLLLIRRMVRDIDFPVDIVSVPTVREADGLAMSSRNMYLTASDREVALCLSRALRAGGEAAAVRPVGDPPGGPRGARRGAARPRRLPRARAPADARRRARVVPGRGAARRRGPGRHDPPHRQQPAPRRPRRRCARRLLRRLARPGRRLSGGPDAVRARHAAAAPQCARRPGGPRAPTSSSWAPGIAGLTCALRLRERVDRVLLVTKTVLSAGSTPWAQGGIAAALRPGGHAGGAPRRHARRRGRALRRRGRAHPRHRGARRGSASSSRWAPSSTATPAGEIKLTREGGHHRDRIAHAGGDATGAEISRALIAALHRVVDDPGIEVIEHALVVDLLTADDGAVCGVTLHVIGEGQVDGVGAAYGRAVVLATGGLGQIYTSTTNPPVATGDGMAAALRAGARVTDLEFVQFHPTVLFLGEGSTGQQPLISEAVRGEGAFLVDGAGARIMAGRHELADLAPRDVVARAILDVMRDQRGRPRVARRPPPRRGLPRAAVPLDRRPLPRARLRPGDRAAARSHRRSTTRPAACETDLLGRSSVDGPLRVRRVLVHRSARRQPARVELAARRARLRAPDRRRRHHAGSPPGSCRCASPASDAGDASGARRLAPPRRAARDDRAGPARCGRARRPRGALAALADLAALPPTRRPSQGRPRGRPPTCCTSGRRCRSSRTGARRPAAATCAPTSPSATTPDGSLHLTTTRPADGSLVVTERPVEATDDRSRISH